MVAQRTDRPETDVRDPTSAAALVRLMLQKVVRQPGLRAPRTRFCAIDPYERMIVRYRRSDDPISDPIAWRSRRRIRSSRAQANRSIRSDWLMGSKRPAGTQLTCSDFVRS